VDRVAVIAVVTRAGIGRAADIFQFFQELGADVQLDIYDMRWLDVFQEAGQTPDLSALAPRPDEVGRFLTELFDLWFWDQEGRVDFRELRQEVKLALQPELNLGDPFDKKRCDFRRLIFAPNGLVFSCDQWVNDDRTALGDIRRDALENILTKKEALWERIKQRIRRSGSEMACGGCEWGRQCGGGCFSCMKYNAMLLCARSEGLPDDRWVDAILPPVWEEIRGETYFCEGLRAFRRHVREVVRRELANAV
jgi:radical SAM protein with 4Fe4S-binding SPASM domain